MKKTLGLLALMIATALTLAACGGSSSTSGTGSTDATYNDADVSFAQDMIPHHQQAVVMAKMARTHASSSRVKQLAADIQAAQGPEIKTMTGWLKDWGGKVPSGSMGGMDEGMDGGMGGGMGHAVPGMMSERAMKRMGTATGRAFDRMFLTMMTKHHEGAVEMARTEQAKGKNPDAVELAKKIEAAQTKEIAQMKQMLRS